MHTPTETRVPHALTAALTGSSWVETPPRWVRDQGRGTADTLPKALASEKALVYENTENPVTSPAQAHQHGPVAMKRLESK